ncbi:hypothetical protein HQQ81_14320 [Microbacteriaceae bacterium VKM Ac-2854]|nr:hypothetical protein [Microbacteriaceae bacterium VKM Ac-2854]
MSQTLTAPSVSATGTVEDFVDAQRTDSADNLVMVPAGLFGNLLSGIAETVGGAIGGSTGRKIGQAASPLLGLIPWSVVPSAVEPQSTAPGTSAAASEDVIVLPAGFFGDLLSAGADLLGQVSGGTVEKVTSTASPFLKLLPWSTVPAGFTPQSAAPGTAATTEDMIMVPAGFFGNLLAGAAGLIGKAVGGSTGEAVGQAAAPLIKLFPWSAIPAGVSPQSAGPGGEAAPAATEDLVVVPAGFFKSLVGGIAQKLSGQGGTVGTVAKVAGVVNSFLPWSTVPSGVAPQSAGPGAAAATDDLVLVPAGFLSGLLGSIGGGFAGKAIGGLFGNAKLGQQIGSGAGGAIGSIFGPFSVVPSGTQA